MKLLEIQSSVRVEGSISRALSHEFIEALQYLHPDFQHQQRDVGTNPPAHPTELWTTANYLPPDSHTPEMEMLLAESERLIAELLWADCLLLGVPMYNFSVPSTLKVYLDNIVRVNRTFRFDPQTHSFQGLAIGKKAIAIVPSAGNFVIGTPLEQMNFCDPYLRSILNFIEIQEIEIVPIPNQFMEDEVRQQEVEKAKLKLMNIAASW